MSNFINLAGRRFGLLQVSSRFFMEAKKTYWDCRCDCGNSCSIRADALRDGRTLSCGCFHEARNKEKRGPLRTTGTIEKFNARWMPVTESGCWFWMGNVCPTTGYGRFHYRHGRPVFAHRFSYLHFKGPIPKGMQVQHTCDIKFCVNPDHLILGDAKQNAEDAIARGLYRIGTEHGMARLTESQVLEIFQSKAGSGLLARQYDISREHVNRIKQKKVWRSLLCK